MDFSGASEAFKRMNPQLAMRDGVVVCRRGVMNRTESEFAMKLEEKKRVGECERWEYEGMTLRWGGMRYTPDFVVVGRGREITLIEVKGGHMWSRDLVRFKGARAYWPEFRFEMWQKRRGEWRRIQ